MMYWRLCAAAGVGICAAYGYQLSGWSGGAVGLLGAVIVVLSIEAAIRAWHERKAPTRATTPRRQLSDGAGHSMLGISAPQGMTCLSAGHALRRRFARRGAFAQQPARNIRSFWCYRTREQTLIFVRLRASRFYCLHMRRAGAGEGARWVVERVEGEEYGAISAPTLELARGK